MMLLTILYILVSKVYQETWEGMVGNVYMYVCVCVCMCACACIILCMYVYYSTCAFVRLLYIELCLCYYTHVYLYN